MCGLVARLAAVIRVEAVWLCTEPMDMRAGTDSALARVVATFGAAHPHHAYVFANRRADRLKVLVYDGAGLWLWPGHAGIARAFYIWLSVFNLLAISVAWSVLADLFSMAQAKRVFALMAAGMSAGGLVGPVLSVALVEPVGYAGMMLVSAAFLMGSAACAYRLQRWRDQQPLRPGEEPTRRSPLGGNPFAGIGTVLRSPYLLGIATFVVLLASVTTFLYFEQARLVALHFPDRVDQTRVFGLLDAIVQGLAILTQVFITGRIVQRLGLAVLLVTVPVVMAFGFLWLALAPTFAVFAAVMVFRRAGGYALARPGREMLFTVVAPEAKYKAKNVIDTAVYRGADAVSGWVKAGIDAFASSPAVVAVAGAGVALAWAFTGAGLARAQARREASVAPRESNAN